MALARERHNQYVNLDPQGILDALSGASLGSTAGQEEVNFLNRLLSVRVAGILVEQLAGLARTVGASSSDIEAAMGQAASTTKAVFEGSSAKLTAALKVNTEESAKNAEAIKNEIAALTSQLAKSSIDLQNGSAQSSRLSS